MANVVHYDIVVNKLELPSRDDVHFRTNTLSESTNSFISSAMD